MDDPAKFFKTAQLPEATPKKPYRINEYSLVEDWDKFLPITLRRAEEGHSESKKLLSQLMQKLSGDQQA